jgi:hypothetical protein
MEKLKGSLLDQSKQRKLKLKEDLKMALNKKTKELELNYSMVNLAKIEEIKKVKEKGVSKRKRANHNHTLSVQTDYYNKYIKDEEKADKNKQTLSRLELVENQLLEKLKSTMSKQSEMGSIQKNIFKSAQVDKTL